MFDYTQAALRKIIDDFKKIVLGINVGTQAVTIFYLIYAVCVQSGVLVANVILLTLAIAYLFFFLYITKVEVEKQLKRGVKEVYKWIKRSVKLLSIVITAYGLIITNNDFHLLPFLLLTFTIVGWVLEFLFYLVGKFLEAEFAFLMEGFHTDINNYTKPFRAVGNFVKKITGKPVEKEPEPNKKRLLLDKLVAKRKVEKEQENLDKRTNFSLWIQDKLEIFKPKKKAQENGPSDLEQIPAPMEEQALTEVDSSWEE